MTFEMTAENGALAARNDLSIFTQIHVLSSVLPCSELYYQASKQQNLQSFSKVKSITHTILKIAERKLVQCSND
jgi:hypothetical protein